MKKRSIVLMLAIMGFATLFIAAGIYAASPAPDMIKMENPAYKKHKKGIVEFSHKKHTADYEIGCGDCHHDANNKPLNDLKDGDAVESCLACHKIPGQVPKDLKKKMKKMKKAEKKSKKLEYHAEAIHMNCIVCHKAFNKKTKTKKAPATCSKCHPKKKK